MSNEQTLVVGRISGFVNTDVELKSAASGKKYLSILLGGQKDFHNKPLPSNKVTFFDKDAELFAATVSKGDLIVVTKVVLKSIVEEGKSYSVACQLIGKDFVKVERRSNTTQNQQDEPQAQSQAQRQLPNQQPQPQAADSFDDDIPF
jgi:single-stranded DNA-binding protein